MTSCSIKQLYYTCDRCAQVVVAAMHLAHVTLYFQKPAHCQKLTILARFAPSNTRHTSAQT
jgi:hypothetical protein